MIKEVYRMENKIKKQGSRKIVNAHVSNSKTITEEEWERYEEAQSRYLKVEDKYFKAREQYDLEPDTDTRKKYEKAWKEFYEAFSELKDSWERCIE